MKTPSTKVRCLDLSDIHLYHDKTPTEHIVKNLCSAIPNNVKMEIYDIIFISGDLFDRSVFLPNKDIVHVIRFIHHLLEVCSKYDIVLRILEGTPSHDWMQSKLVTEINDTRENKVDLKHVSVLSIEYIERFDLNVLYVPDEWGSGCESTFLEVKDLLIKNNLQKVDLAIMHGCFNYQFPVNLVGKPDVHDEASYLGITKYIIVIGHYHISSQFERIYVPGSFDRLKHGEEEPKGFLDFTLYDNGDFSVNFIENPNAMVYKTLDCGNMSVQEVYKLVSDFLAGKQYECHIRILAEKEDPIYSGLSEIKKSFPFVHFTIRLRTKVKIKEQDVPDTIDIVRPSSLSIDVIRQLMRTRLEDKHPTIVKECLQLLDEVIND